MCTFKEMISRVQTAKNSCSTFASEIIQEPSVEYEILSLNKKQLYEEGEGSDKKKLMSYRNPFYADMKAELRGGLELTDLFLTGEFQRNFYIISDNQKYEISSTDSKTNKLVNKYGQRIFGLTENNKVEAQKIVKPRLIERINDVLQLTII